MKHQLFKKNTYVEINTGFNSFDLIGQVKDSTITTKEIRVKNDVFNTPVEAIELNPEILIISENPEIPPVLLYYPETTLARVQNITVKDNRVFVAVSSEDCLSLPSKELKALYYKLNHGAK